MNKKQRKVKSLNKFLKKQNKELLKLCSSMILLMKYDIFLSKKQEDFIKEGVVSPICGGEVVISSINENITYSTQTDH